MCYEISKENISEDFEIQHIKQNFEVYYQGEKLKRLRQNYQVFEIPDNIKKIIETKIKKKIDKNIILKINAPSKPFDLKDSSLYHKKYIPYYFSEKEIFESAERQWDCQKIASENNLAPKIIMKGILYGLIFTIMERIEDYKIDKIIGKENLNFAKSKKDDIIKSVQKLHDNGVIHGDILTNSSIYTNQIHNIYYDNQEVGFIDFGESRCKNEVLKYHSEEEFEKWKKIEMEIIKEKLFTTIKKEDYEEYIKINDILQNNFNSHFN